MNEARASANYSEVILEHYRKEAELHGRDASSTMQDQITRGREVASIQRVLEFLCEKPQPPRRALDIGCGNGYLLEVLRQRFPGLGLEGLEYTPEMVQIAKKRNVPECQIQQGDVLKLPYPDSALDVVITERCIINVMNAEDQATALGEVARILKPGGHFLCIEAFADGLAQLNEARAELGLTPNQQPHHNIWFDKAWFLRTIEPLFSIVDLAVERDPTLPSPNFLSSHYFISRALYPAITRREVLYNTHLVKFFSFLPPMGNYSPIQFFVLQKR